MLTASGCLILFIDGLPNVYIFDISVTHFSPLLLLSCQLFLVPYLPSTLLAQYRVCHLT